MHDPNDALRSMLDGWAGDGPPRARDHTEGAAVADLPDLETSGRCADARRVSTTGTAQQVLVSGPDGPRSGVAIQPSTAAASLTGSPADGHVDPAATRPVGPPPAHRRPPSSSAQRPLSIAVEALVPGDLVCWRYLDGVQVGVVTGVSRSAALVHLTPLRSAGRIQVTKPVGEVSMLAGIGEIEADARRVR